MPAFRTSPSWSTLFAGLVATLSFTACLPVADVVGTGGNNGAGTGGQTGTGGGATSGSGGTIGTGGRSATGGNSAGTGGATVPGTGGANSGGAGSSGSGGRQGTGGTGNGGRAGTGGRAGGAGGAASTPDGGVPDGSSAGTGGGAAGGTSGNVPAGYAVCVPCHGANGVGVAGHGPDIQHPVVDFATWVIRNGRTHPDFPEPMPKMAVDVLTDAQLQGILTYLKAPPKPTTGQALFLDFCANCHGANAAGGVTTRPINTEVMTKFTSMVRDGHSAGQFAMRREYMPKWTTTELTDADIRLIFTHVEGL